MSILSRKYPFEQSAHWLRDSAVYCIVVFLILYFLQPFGFSGTEGNKLLLSALFGILTFLCCAVYGWAVARPLQKRVKPWRIWHQALTVLGMVLFIGICNYILFSVYFHYPFFAWWLFLRFLYWTLIIGVMVSALSVGSSYYRHLRSQLDTLLEKTTEEQKGVTVTIQDTRVRGNDVSLPINDLLYVEAQKNNVVVGYVKDGKLAREELQTTLAAVLTDLGEYENIFQCHRSFIVNLNNISSAKGNSNGYTLELGGGLATVPVSRSFVPKLKSFIA